MTNRRIADVLFNIATLLDLAQDNVYRVRAYRRAAVRVLALREEAAVLLARGEALPLPGVGQRIRRKVAELVTSGSMAFYQDLLDDLPAPQQALMALQGMGPKTARRLTDDLHLASPQDLLAAAEQGKIRDLYGFGARSEANLARAARAALDAACAAA
jgi:DNA polymerase (family 10)